VSVFETLRQQVPIHQLVEKNGGKTHCVNPDHGDANPSMQVYEDHVYCFACGFHGDVTDVWAAIKGFDRPIDAALDLACEYGVELSEQSSESKRRARERREMEDQYLRYAWACHRALDRHEVVREWWEERGFGGELRVRFLLGASENGTAAIIPFWNRGRVQGLIRRKLEGEPKYLYPKAEEFPRGYKPLFIPPGPVRGSAFLVEGIVDALAVAALGESAIAVGGTSISEEQMQALCNVPRPLYVLPDADDEGIRAARRWVRDLYPKALLCPAKYGE
jgi:DNA primase